MAQDPNKFNELSGRLTELLQKQNQLQADIRQLQREMESLKPHRSTSSFDNPESSDTVSAREPSADKLPQKSKRYLQDRFRLSSKTGLDWEQFIGENLISKIGILITVIGVSFGVKYAIDREWITPLARIILGYLAGVGLLGLAIRLKAKYEDFSAVLLSGALAILYIITYFAYSYYDLMAQGVASALMVLFTSVTVFAALQYDRQIIALMGLVGAYGVPFLLSEDSGRATVLFSYMTIINGGILVIACRKYWKGLFNTAFWLSWLIFSWWMIMDFNPEQHFVTGLIFAGLFFGLFYATTLAYKLSHQEVFKRGDTLLLLANSFFFFGFGYVILRDDPGGEQFLGAFALFNAAVHFGVGMLVDKVPLADRNLYYFTIGLGIVFLTIAVPTELDGNWVTLLWAGEAALLFGIGRYRQVTAYEKMAFPLILLAFGSLLQDWSAAYNPDFYGSPEEWLRPVINVQMLSSLLVSAAFGGMIWIQQRQGFRSGLPPGNWWRQGFRFVIPAFFLLILYYAFRFEISYYWNLQEQYEVTSEPVIFTTETHAFDHLSAIWVVLYSLLFLILLSWINMMRIQDRILGWVNLGLNVFGILAFLVAALFSLSELRDLFQENQNVHDLVSGHFYLRYLTYALVAALLFTTYRYQRMNFVELNGKKWPFDLLLHLTVFWTASGELIHWMDLSGAQNTYKLGLSILWGIYALFLIALGIFQRKAHLRVGAIALFAVTLIKLFFYDIVDLSTMAKTVVLLSLGGLLLISSFLYNKFKDLIAGAPGE